MSAREPNKKRKREGGKEKATVGQLTSHIKNKQVRADQYGKLRHKAKKEKGIQRKKRQEEQLKAEQLGIEGPKRQIPRTIENTREKDVTMIAPDDTEVDADDAQDEFADYFSRQSSPNVLLTTCYKPSKLMFHFLADMLEVLPCAQFFKRQGTPIKKIVKYATARGFTDVMVFNENKKHINGLLLIHLPAGPTAHFKLSSLKLSKDIKGHGRAARAKPELVLNNFDTRLGHRMGRMFASLFHQDPSFRSRQVATLHNQRDFIFFRHHRYIFEEKKQPKNGQAGPAVGARLQELGPRFTLKLRSLQLGTFDSKEGEFEYVHKPKMNVSRRRFYL
ncbi:g12743 [Coccomyxa viridis]|uniref:G12743 protein n=1 Tax=Coccomyxa viridis TaxID=1274662 RepID=A0ABP1GF82_9CHLO